jgi:hypothetical protein
MKRFATRLLCLVALWSMGAAANAADQMVKSARTEFVPEAGKALVIFVRASIVVGAYSAPIIDLDAKVPEPKPGQPEVEDRMVGILSGYSKVAYQAAPGEHTFMSVAAGGGPGLLAKATLQEGKTYYVLVRPNWGFSPSFTLQPLRNDPKAEFRLDSPELAGWLKSTDFYEPTPVAEAWLNGNRPSVQGKKSEALAKWKSLPDAEKMQYTLLETDSK